VVVPYANGKNIDPSYFSKLAANYSQPNIDPPVDGPVVITTQALLDPHKPAADPTKPNVRLLDKDALDLVVRQVQAINNSCPSCLRAIALKPTFDPDTGLPEMCALDYLLNATPTDSDHLANNCYAKFGYSNHAAYDAVRGALADDRSQLYPVKPVTLIGVGFMANEDPAVPSCSVQGELGKYLSYSRMALNLYYKPSVWYAVGIAVGPTATPGCTFSEPMVASGYASILAGIPGFSASGVIGVAPYRFLDSPALSPLACIVPAAPRFTATHITRNGANQPLTLPSIQPEAILSSDADQTSNPSPNGNPLPIQSITVRSITLSNDTLVTFIGGDDRAHLARMESGQPHIYDASCDYGFRDMTGQLRDQSSFAWFSACKFYYTNDAHFEPNFVTTDPVYTEKSTQQPLMFSTNARGGVCSPPFNAGKMLTRANPPLEKVVSSSVPAEQQRIASLQCGACLSEVAMPKNFCTGANYNVPHDACTDYAQIDDAALLKEVDPVLLRAISVGEGSHLGTEPEINGPACSMGPSNSRDCGNDNKDYNSLATPYCTGAFLADKAKKIIDNGQHICGLGLAQCIRNPSANYNPFNPYESAQCSADEFLNASGTPPRYNSGRYLGRLKFLQNALKSTSGSDTFNPQKGGIAPNELEWYAAWMGAQAYHGETIQEIWLTGYVQRSPDDTLVKYVLDQLTEYCNNVHASKPKAECVPTYGLRALKLYNAGIQECGNGCPHQPAC
jgi:hypothetical protein